MSIQKTSKQTKHS